MKRAFAFFLVCFVFLPVPAVADDIGRSVYSAVFEGEPPAAGGGASPEYRQFYRRYEQTRLKANPDPGNWEESALQNKKRALERAVFAFGAGRATAVRISKSIPLALEWEGMADGPLAEARAAQTLAGDPSVAKAHDFLLLFSAHHYRAAAEAAILQRLAGEEDAGWKGYRTQLALALAASDPLIRAAALVLAGKAEVYLPIEKAAACRTTANGVPFVSPGNWLQRCHGDSGEGGALVEFPVDVDGDGVPERFAALQRDLGQAGGPFQVFRQTVDGVTYFGSVPVHPQAVILLPLDAAGRPRIERFWRTGAREATVDVFVHDGRGFRLLASRPATSEDRARYSLPEKP